MAEEKQSTFSFGFSKKKESSKLVESAIKEDQKDEVEETEFVTSLEDREVNSTKPKEEKKLLVIPLIEKNKWHVPTPQDLEQSDTTEKSSKAKDSSSQNSKLTGTKTGDDITDQALQELVTEANKQQEEWDERGDYRDPNRQIPLLMVNKVPDGTETDDRLDVSIRPNEAATADYDEVPIEEYGMAMLRGMGFKEGQGIGKNNKSVAPIVAVARPKGLGLGADRSLSLQQKDGSNAGNKEAQPKEDLVMKKGACCVIQGGKHQGLYATVEGIDEDNARVVVKLAIGNTILTINQMAVKLVTRKDFDKNSKYLNKSKVEEFKEKESRKHDRSRSRDRRSRSRDRDSGHDSERHGHRSKDHHKLRHDDRHRNGDDRDSHRHKDDHHSNKDRSHRDSDHDNYKRRKRGRDSDRSHRSRSPLDREESSSSQKHKSKDRVKSKEAKATWLRSNLKVRIVDKKYKRGDYYKSKVFIEDVVSLDSCNCRTESGKLLEGLSLDYLETVIPKDKESPVMVVSGKHKGKVGKILEKDSSSCEALVQILPDCDEILTLGFDVICEYVGNINDLY